MALIVHSSLKSIGDICGGVVAVILALEDVLGDQGTLVMPTHSAGLSDPAGWSSPPAPCDCIQQIRDEMPAYDADLTPTRKMGFLNETFRKQRAVIRSSHPHVSFAAWGRYAYEICGAHALDYGLGEGSPLAKLYALNGFVLLLGVDHSRNTSLHLAEHRLGTGQPKIRQRAPMMVNGQREWVEFDDIAVDDSCFLTIGADFERDTELVRQGNVGDAVSRLMPQTSLVDYARTWMANKAR